MTASVIEQDNKMAGDLSKCLPQDETVIWSSYSDNQKFMRNHNDYIMIRVIMLGIFFTVMVAITAQHNGADVSEWDPITIFLWGAFIVVLFAFARQIASVTGTPIKVLYGITNKRVLAFDPNAKKIVGDMWFNRVRAIHVRFLGAETNFVFQPRSNDESPFSLTFINMENPDEVSQVLHETTGIKPKFSNSKK